MASLMVTSLRRVMVINGHDDAQGGANQGARSHARIRCMRHGCMRASMLRTDVVKTHRKAGLQVAGLLLDMAPRTRAWHVLGVSTPWRCCGLPF